MKSSRRLDPIILVVTLFTLGLLGCAHAPKYEPPSLSEEDKSQLGTIGVVSASFQPSFLSEKPMTKGKGAKAGATVGAAGCLKVGWDILGATRASGGDPLAGATVAAIGLGAIALTPVAAAVGGIVGAVKGVDEIKINEADSALNLVLGEIDIQAMLRDRLLSVAREKTSYPFSPIDEKGPHFLGEEVSYQSRIQTGVDTILELTVSQFSLSSASDGPRINPPLTLFMEANVRMVQVSEGKVLYNHTFSHEGEGKKKFTDWAENHGRPFKEGLDRSLDSLARQIVSTIFGLQGT